MRVLSFVLVTCLVSWSPVLEAKTIVQAGKLIDGRADTVAEKKSLIIEEGRIVDVVDGFVEPAEGDAVYRLEAATV